MKFLVLSGQMYKGASLILGNFNNNLAICSCICVLPGGLSVRWCGGKGESQESYLWLGNGRRRKTSFLLLKKLKQCMEVQEQKWEVQEQKCGCFAANWMLYCDWEAFFFFNGNYWVPLHLSLWITVLCFFIFFLKAVAKYFYIFIIFRQMNLV